MDSNSYWGRIEEPLEYRVGRLWKLAFLTIAFLEGLGSARLTLNAPLHPNPAAMIAVAGCLMCIAVFCSLYAFRASIRITSGRIDYRWAFTTSSMLREEVIGKKKGYTSIGRELYLLVSHSGRLMLVDRGTFDVDDRFSSWLESLPTIENNSKPNYSLKRTAAG